MASTGTGKSTQCRAAGRLVECEWRPCRWLLPILVEHSLAINCGRSSSNREPRCRLAPKHSFMASRGRAGCEGDSPNLEAGCVVVSDRFITANVVYQGHAGGIARRALAGWPLSSSGLMPTCFDPRRRSRPRCSCGRAADRMESRGVEYRNESARASWLRPRAIPRDSESSTPCRMLKRCTSKPAPRK